MALVRQILAGICTVLLMAPALAGEMRYIANEHQSRWTAEGSRLHCSLSHEIPHYGRAVFESRPGAGLGFHIEAQRRPRDVGVAKVIAAVPDWKHDARARDLGQVSYTVEHSPIRFDEIMARRLLLELERGMFPTFAYQDWSDGRDRILVALSAVNFRRSLGEFLACLEAVVPYSFEDVRDSRIQFGFDSSELSAEARTRLDKVADYLQADPAVQRVTLEGLTDNKGFRRYNEALARRRAEAVRDYLLASGAEAQQYRIRAIGERQRLASNRTAQGRAANRAVLVTLVK